MKNPLVSVIIPVYNGADYITQAVESVEKSSFRDLETILINDGSKDDSKQICQKLSKQYTNIVFIHRANNQGLSESLNYAIETAKGKYICRLNQDDIILPDRIQTQVDFLNNNPDYVMVGGALQLCDEKGKVFETLCMPLTDAEIRNNWLYLNSFADPAVLYRKTAVIQAGLYKQEFYPADDMHLWYRMGRVGKLANLKQVVTRMRIHDRGATMRIFRTLIKQTWKLHLWSVKHVQKPTWGIWIYWSLQYVLGRILPVKFNFFAYRLVKKAVFLKSQLNQSR